MTDTDTGGVVAADTKSRKYQDILEKVMASLPEDASDEDKVLAEEQAANLYLQYRCLTDLYFLATAVFKMDLTVDGKKNNRLDPVFHRWLAETLKPDKDGLILVPRGHTKSTWVKMKILQLVLRNPNIRIGLFSRTSGLVESQLAEIKLLFSNAVLRKIFSDRIPEPGKRYKNWKRSTANELTIFRSDEWGRIPQECQIEAWGAGATITGRHYDVIVMDDIINEKSCSTLEQIRKIREWYSYIQSIKDPDGFEIIVGTRYHFSDIYGTIIKGGWFRDRVFVRSAVEDGKPIYSYFTLAKLAKIKSRVSSFEWSCQYENNPIPKEDQIFTPPFPTYSFLPPGRYRYYTTVDPAATTGQYSNQTAIAVAAVDETGQVYVCDAYGFKKKPDETAEEIVKRLVQYTPVACGIEFGLQAGLQYILDLKIAEYESKTSKKIRTRVEKIVPPNSMSKVDKINRQLGGLMKVGKIYIHEDLTDLMSQMEFFPKSSEDDIVDAVAMLVELIGRFSGPNSEHTLRYPKDSLFGLFKDEEAFSWEHMFVS